jgi:arginase family enzyme
VQAHFFLFLFIHYFQQRFVAVKDNEVRHLFHVLTPCLRKQTSVEVSTICVEVAPPFDPTGNTALTGATLMFEILCAVAQALSRR